MLKDSITAEATPSQEGRRAWMLIRPTEDRRIQLVRFEHDETVDTDSWLAPEDLLDRRVTYFETLDEAVNELERQGIDTDAFDALWKMDYPI